MRDPYSYHQTLFCLTRALFSYPLLHDRTRIRTLDHRKEVHQEWRLAAACFSIANQFLEGGVPWIEWSLVSIAAVFALLARGVVDHAGRDSGPVSALAPCRLLQGQRCRCSWTHHMQRSKGPENLVKTEVQCRRSSAFPTPTQTTAAAGASKRALQH